MYFCQVRHTTRPTNKMSYNFILFNSKTKTITSVSTTLSKNKYNIIYNNNFTSCQTLFLWTSSQIDTTVLYKWKTKLENLLVISLTLNRA